jgi:signal peptide peptidase SppA
MLTIPAWIRPYMPVERLRHPPPVVTVVRLYGIIGKLGPLRGGLTLATLAPILERAFRLREAKAVALAINSPGGSPVQSALIARRIRALAAEHKKPVFAFAEDVAASGGYWLLAAGDELFGDESSIIGSIGVISAGFGFPELLRRFGVERRVYTAGAHKDGLDPFQPEKPEEIAHLRRIQDDIHEAFRAHVRARRQGKLKGVEDELFSGRFWGGGAAVERGLIDGLGDLRTVMRQRFGDKVRLVVVDERRSWLRRRFGLSRDAGAIPDIGARFADRLIDGIEERLLWSRFGL